EDGIRDLIVTGVQTCALPISFIDPTFVGPCPHRQVQVAEPVKRRIDESTLGHRQVGRIVVQLCGFGDGRVFYVTHNADDHVPFTVEIDTLTERVPAGEVSLRCSFADNDYIRYAKAIIGSKRTATLQGDAHSGEVVSQNPTVSDCHRAGEFTSLDFHHRVARVSRQWQVC